MKVRKQRKKNILVLLLVLLCSLSFGYALLTRNLMINGSSKIHNSTWDIHFENLNVTDSSVELSDGDVAATIQSSTTDVAYTITLNTPGDFYEFTVDAVNAGSIDGMVESVTSKLNDTVITTLPAYLDYKVTYSDDAPIEVNHLLKKGETETYKVRVEFKKDIEKIDLPESTITLSFDFSVVYVQADGKGINRLRTPNYVYATPSYLLTKDGNLYYYDINNLSYDSMPATLENLGAQLVAENVKHFNDGNRFYLTNDNTLYNLDDNSVIEENIDSIYLLNHYFITDDHRLFFIENGNATFIADNIDYIYKFDMNSKNFLAIDLDGKIHYYLNNQFQRTIFDGNAVSFYTSLFENNKFIMIKDSNSNYYFSYLEDSYNYLDYYDITHIKTIFSPFHYGNIMGMTNNNTLVDLTNPSIIIHKPIIKIVNMDLRFENNSYSIMTDENNKLYYIRGGSISDSGYVQKKCVIYKTDGDGSHSYLCIDENDYLHIYGKQALYKNTNNEITQNIKISDIGQLKDSVQTTIYLKSFDGSIYEPEYNNPNYDYKLSNISEGNIEWHDDSFGEYDSNYTYDYTLDVNSIKNALNSENHSKDDAVCYYSDCGISNILNDSSFNMILTDGNWIYTKKNDSGR